MSGATSTGGFEVMTSGRGGDGPGDTEDRLEKRYRRLLTVLPKAYREARGEEMLGALMDGAPEGRNWPKLGEVLSMLVHGAKVRSGARGEGPTKDSAMTLLRAVALTGSLLFTFLAGLTGFECIRFWSRADVSKSIWSDLHSDYLNRTLVEVETGSALVWLGAYAAMVLGWRRTARALSAVTVVVAAMEIDGWYSLLTSVPQVIVVTAIWMSTPRGFSAARRPIRWFAILVPLAALGWYLEYGFHAENRRDALWLLTPMSLFGVAAVVVAVRKARHSPVWPLAFALVGAMQVGLQAEYLFTFPFAVRIDPRLVITGFFEGALLLVAAYAVVRQRKVLAAQRSERLSA